MKTFFSRAVIYSLVIIVGLLCALPNVLPQTALEKLPDWYAHNKITLGLDLRGGSHLLLEVDTSDLLRTHNQQLADQLSSELRTAGILHSKLEVDGMGLRLVPQDPTQLPMIQRIARALIKQNTSAALYEIAELNGQLHVQSTEQHLQQLTKDAVERSLEVVRRRLDETGMVEPMITRQGQDSILVQLPGVNDPHAIRQLLGTTARMTFHWAANEKSRLHTNIISLPGQLPSERYQLEERVALEGKHISDARLGFNQDTNEPVVNFHLDKEGARRFGDMTQKNVGRVLAIVLDDRVVTAPVIRDAIQTGRGEISGAFTSADANELALLLRAGALPAPLNVIEERTVGPDLGSDAISMGISTGVMGALLVLAFMVGVYGRWGFIACMGLALNIGLSFGVLSLLGATLTLPGIAGFILSVGMAVDANILINERIREETRRGQSALGALDAGFKRAYSTILDSNVTSLIAISLLFLFGSGPVRGFAVTMAVGLLISMFTAISFTRLVMEWRVKKLGKNVLEISGIKALDRISNNPIHFMRGRFVGLIASAILSIASIVLFIQPGLDYGIDFSGGTVIEVAAPTASVADVRSSLQAHHLAQVAIQEFGSDGHYLMRLPLQSAEDVAPGALVQEVKAAVVQVAPDAQFPRVEMVGPRVSGDFGDATILAIILAGLGILGYLWLRFESHFALAATVTLALDLTKTIGFFVLAGVEFNLTAVAALLALIGYSVNDKVVVFDRIRENLRIKPDMPWMQLLNESITSTLTRTVFTSVTTFLALLPMAIAGGSAVSSFALPMLFGIVIGTSSSIFIAAPMVLLMGQRRLQRGLTQLRPQHDEMPERLP